MFDPLHVALIGLLTAFFGGLFVFLYNRTKFVSYSACKERHESLGERLKKGDTNFDLIADCLTELVIRNPDIPPDIKAKLLSRRAESKD